MKKLEGMLVYVQVQEAVKAFVKPGQPAKPNEWKASVVITDKAVKKEFEKFAKSLNTLVSLKEVETSEFESKYKVAPPEDAGDEVWIATLRKSTELGKTGKPVPEQFRPRVYEQVGNTRIDVTATKLPANGSYGAISFDVFTKTNGEGSIFLKNVLVTDMIEYIKPDASLNDGSEFDGDDDNEVDGDDDNQKLTKQQAKVQSKQKPQSKNTVDDDAPF